MDAREQLRTAYQMLHAMGDGRASPNAPATSWWPPARTSASARSRRSNGLTAQEAQIAAARGHGHTNPEISTQLFISPRTVEWHLRKVFTKLGISSRKELRVALSGLERVPLPT